MAETKASSFPTSEYNFPTKKPKYSNVSSRSSNLLARRSSPELQVGGNFFCGNLDVYTALLTEIDAFNECLCYRGLNMGRLGQI